MSSADARGVVSTVNSTALRGIAAVMIMLGHFLPDANLGIRFFFAGHLWVSMFFFYSGYGLQYSISVKENYLRKIPKKMLKIYIPFLLAETAYTLSLLLQGKTMSLGEIIACCIGLKLANTTLWYIIEILVLYGLFGCIHRWVNLKYHNILWGGLYGIFVMFAVLFDVGTWWYISTISFLLGVMYYSGSGFTKFYSRGKVIAAIVLFAALYILEKGLNAGKLGAFLPLNINYCIVAVQFVLAPLFVVFMDLLLRRKILTGKMLQYLGNASYEIYLLHMLIFLWVKGIATNKYIVAACASVVTIILALLIKVCTNRVWTDHRQKYPVKQV